MSTGAAPPEPGPETRDAPTDRGLYEARYLAFLETIAQLRPSLHRYCARMTGSVTDGEDLVQEALFHAYRRLHSFDEDRPLKPWLFRIAHHRCVDFLRRRGVREEAEAGADTPGAVLPDDQPGAVLGRAVEHLVLTLPPKERACVLLKDVLDYSLEEIAELVDSTVGGVKAALHRGRAKLAAATHAASPQPTRTASPQLTAVLGAYVERFNRRDWDGLRELVSADTRVLVADRFAGRLADSPYFGQYQRLAVPWRLRVAEVDGEPVAVSEFAEDGVWAAQGVVRLEVRGGRVVGIADYIHCPWVLQAAERATAL